MVEILRIDAEKWRSRFQSQTEAQQATQRKRLSTGPFGAVGSASLVSGPSPLLSPIALADLAGASEPSEAFALPR
jgi:hypothetical protein